ncbi:hypothetical protein V5G24_21175 [Xanthobacter sp. VTT E-85241]|uniref:DUF6878 family protein n=1 Tax=Xanthobacteraceae TaxID=335928 RepID=UPI00372A5AA0
MTKDNPTPITPAGLDDWSSKLDESHRQAVDRLTSNKETLFNALAAAGITSVAVNFDGYGDSGQIESIDALAGAEAVSLPDTLVEIAGLAWGEPEARTQLLSLRAAIEELAYDFLGQTHGGWQDGDGAYGDFTFDVEQRSISLDYNERYSATENYVHEF